MEYIVYKRFKGEGLDGSFNLRHGTVCEERDGFLFAPDGRRICAATSENGWGHFRQNTPEGAFRQEMLERLYKHYQRRPELTAEDFDEMLALLEGGWEDVYKPALKAEDPKSSSGLSDEDYDFLKVYQKLGRRVSSMATATKRVVSDSQSKQAEELQKRINDELRQLFEQKSKN